MLGRIPSEIIYRLGVRVGEHDIQSKIDCQTAADGTKKCNGPVQDLAIEKIIPHPEYNTKIIQNDIGLLRVSKMNLSVGKLLASSVLEHYQYKRKILISIH